MPKELSILHEIPYTRADRREPFVLAFAYFYLGNSGVVKGPKIMVDEWFHSVVPQMGPCIVHYTSFRNKVKTISFDVFGLTSTNRYYINAVKISSNKPRIKVSVFQAPTAEPARSIQPIGSRDRWTRPRPVFNPAPRLPLYEKFIREMPRSWFQDFDVFVPKVWSIANTRRNIISLETNNKMENKKEDSKIFLSSQEVDELLDIG